MLSCKVATDEAGRSRGFGFVHYETAEAADTAIKAVNGMLLNDKKVYVGHYISKKERQAAIDEQKSQFTNLYIKNIDPELTEEQFREMFEKYGEVTSAVISFDMDGKSKGFGFVNYKEHEGAQAAVDNLHDTEINGRKLFVTRAQKKAEREEELRRSYEQAKMEKLSKYQGVNLYIKNLDDDMSDEKLRSEFEEFGTITSCKIMRDERGQSKGFGFVCFSSPDEATKAVAEMNNKMIGTKPLYVSLAQRREVRKQQLELQIQQRNHIRMQQAAAAGMPGGYLNGPMYYPPGPGGFPPQGRGMMGYGGPQGMMPPRAPRYPPNGQGMPMPPYGQGPPQGYGNMQPGYGPRGGAPRGRGGPGQSPPGQAPAQLRGGPVPPGPNGAPQQAQRMPGGPPAQAPRQQPAVAPAMRQQQKSAARTPAEADGEIPQLTRETLAAFDDDPMRQKQMIGEALYMKIVLYVPQFVSHYLFTNVLFRMEGELAGKITGMLLEMDKDDLLRLLESQDALNAKVNEALTVLNEFSKQDSQVAAAGPAPIAA